MKNRHLKGLSYEPNQKPVKPVRVTEIVLVMVIIMLILWGLDMCGIIHVSNHREY